MPTVAVRELPGSLQKALRAIAYNQSSVEILVQGEVSLSGAGEGRTFYIVNLANGEHRLPKKSESGRTARLGRSLAVIQTGGESTGAIATIYVGRAESVPMMTVARLIPRQEDAERVIRASSVSTSAVSRQREVENETAKLAEMVEREHERRAKGEGREADEALARAEAILAAPAQTRTIHIYDPATGKPTGRTVPAGAIRETMLKRLNIEFGANAPIYVTCANCNKVFAVKAGTRPNYIPSTCKGGCRCECGRIVDPRNAGHAVRVGHRAKCRECNKRDRLARLTAKHTSMTPEEYREHMLSVRAVSIANAKARTHCSKGHELAVVGRTANGTCRECHEASALARRVAYGENPFMKGSKTHCKRGHEYAVVGRQASGDCIQCQKDANRARYAARKADPSLLADKTHCSRGHEFALVGRRPNGMCVQCRKDDALANRVDRKVKTHCVKGHDLSLAGRRSNGECVECHREDARARAAAKRASKTK